MKAKIKITTLTPVHIGSGVNYMNRAEFITQRDEDDFLWGGIIDLEKMVDIIGDENIHRLTNEIENKADILKFIQKYKPDLRIEEICKRTFVVYGDRINEKKDLKEQQHSANRPVIPGSSLKGAFRTAILSYLIKNYPQPAKNILKNYKKSFENWSLWDFQKISQKIENYYLTGVEKNTANNDFFRFFIIGDALFQTGDTIAIVVKVLSLRNNGWEFKDGSQLTECIGAEVETETNLKIKELDILRNRAYRNIKITRQIQEELINIFSSPGNLFKIVNAHTKKLLDREIALWKEQIQEPNPASDIIETYLEDLEKIKEQFSDNNNECIIRVGANEGWDFITGAWANAEYGILNKEQWDKLYHYLNKNRQVDIFPKSRKIDEDGYLMGFIKLEIL